MFKSKRVRELEYKVSVLSEENKRIKKLERRIKDLEKELEEINRSDWYYAVVHEHYSTNTIVYIGCSYKDAYQIYMEDKNHQLLTYNQEKLIKTESHF